MPPSGNERAKVVLSETAQREVAEAHALFDSGDYAAAVPAFTACLRFFEEDARTRASREHAALLTSLGAAQAETGEVGLAIKFTVTALHLMTAADDTRGQAIAHYNLGNMYRYVNRWNPSLDHYKEAARLYEAISDVPAAFRCRLAIANFYAMCGSAEAAASELEKVEHWDQSFLDPLGRWGLCTVRGEVARLRGLHQAAEEQFREALANAEESGDVSYVHQAKGNLGSALLEAGSTSTETESLLEAAYQWSRTAKDRRWINFGASLADLLAKTDRRLLSIALYRDCLDETDIVRSQAEGTEKYLLMERDVAYGLRYVALLFDEGEAERSFAASERVQGRTLLDGMFRHQLKRQEGRHIRVQAMGRLGLAAPSFQEVAAYCRANELHVLRFLQPDKERTLAWWLSPDGELHHWEAPGATASTTRVASALFSASVLDAPRKEASVHRGISITDEDLLLEDDESARELTDALATLYGDLFPIGIREKFEHAEGRLLIVPHRELWFVPFDALGPSTAEPLGSKWDIGVCPSVGIALQLDPRRDAERVADKGDAFVAGIASASSVSIELLPGTKDVVEVELPALSGAADEATSVAARRGAIAVPEDQVTVSTFQKALEYATLIHLAAHAVWNPLDPVSSSLVLYAGEKLGFSMIEDMTSHAELVVLSACQTALDMPKGDSPLGLAHAFLIAGCRRVIASLWPVPDDATREFFDDFHASLPDPSVAATALSRARALSMKRHGRDKVLHWAAFRMIGSPVPCDESERASFGGPVFAGGDVVCVGERFPRGTELDLGDLRDFRGKLGSGVLLK